MARAELVFLPSPGVGHLVSTAKFATQLLDRDHRLSVTVLVINFPSDGTSKPLPPSTTERLRYLRLPPVDPPSELYSKSIEKFAYVWMERYKSHVRDAIVNHVLSASNPHPIVGLVLDLFFSMMIDVGRELGLPSYMFFTSGAAFYGLLLFLGDRHQQGAVEFEESDSDSDSIIPSFLHPVPTRALPSFAFNKEGGYSSMVAHGQKFREADAIIINTFAELEPHAVSSLSEHGGPPIYTVGPILDLKSEHRPSSDEARSRDIMAWLDGQPTSSVVLLCFGSWGSFSIPQIKEIAKGLQKSGKRFLWSLRRPREDKNFGPPSDFDDFNDVLPDGFGERTKEKGLLCGWVPQVDVLAHKAIGGFVSHCGWNSVLESVWHGVPLVAWPLYAEQQINAFELVKDLGLAVEMKIDYRMNGEDLVCADEIERALRSVMESDGEVRKRVAEVSEKSRKAVNDGGSSYLSLGKLIDDILSKPQEESKGSE